MIFGNCEIKENNLFIGGISACELARQYDTPLYVFDEDEIRKNCTLYRISME